MRKHPLIPAAAIVSTFILILALCGLANAQNHFSSNLSLNDITPAPRPLLAIRNQNLAVDGPWSFKIPKQPKGFTNFDWKVSYSYTPLVGGQNRSNLTHPGFVTGELNAAVQIWHNFNDIHGVMALPGMGTGRMIGSEWGPTEPALGNHFPPQQWEEQYELGNPSIYWGPSPFDAGEPRRYTHQYTLLPGQWLSPHPEQIITLDPEISWDVPDWNGTHAYAWAVDWRATVICWGRWVP
tara:strand:- start:706 stop:1419 length:714 start_codon:yes stop_codon:yes gene_type:complete